MALHYGAGMIPVALHVYYNNNSLSSAWPVWMTSIPNIGDKVWYQLQSANREEDWQVVDVIHHPVSYHKEPDDETRPSVAVHCRPSWVFDPDDYRNQRD